MIDEQCPQGVRILDFHHAVGYLHQAAHAAFGEASPKADHWLDTWVPRFRTNEPEPVLAALRALPSPEAATAKGTAMLYLGQRQEQIHYAAFQEQGLPSAAGSWSVRGNSWWKRLMEGGMHCAAASLNPLLALRACLYSGQWAQTCPLIHQHWRQHRRDRGRQNRRAQ